MKYCGNMLREIKLKYVSELKRAQNQKKVLPQPTLRTSLHPLREV